MTFCQFGPKSLVRVLALTALMLVSLHSAAAPETVWIDVRTADEFAEGHLPVAVNIPHEVIAGQVAEYAPDKDVQVVLYCRSGRRAEIAKESLEQLGYRQEVNAVELNGATQLYNTQQLQHSGANDD